MAATIGSAFPLDKLEPFFERTRTPLSIADPALPDVPLLMVNAAFEALTGYTRSDMIGRNCRLLQPEGGAGPVRERIRRFMADETRGDERFIVPNIASDGHRFVNLLYLARLRDAAGRTYFLGSQFDVSRKSAADTYDRALCDDLDNLRLIGGDMGIRVLGTFGSLASSATIIAQSRISHV